MEQKVESNNIVIPRSQFTRLLAAIKLIENACTDCHINEGFIRQKTNDRHCIIEMNLSTILANNELIFSNIKQKISLLKSFELDDTVTVTDQNILLEVSDKDYKFIDPFSKMTFRKTLVKFLDNSNIPMNDFSKLIKFSEEDLVFSININSYMAKRIRTICQGYSNETVRCDFKGLTAALSVSTTNNESATVVCDNIDLNTEIKDCCFKTVYLPFSLDINSEISFKTYRMSNDVLLCKYDQSYFGIPISIYSQVKLTQEKI
jgi:hypothetical protein